MRKTLKIISLILVAAMLLGLCGCGSVKLHADKMDLRLRGNGGKSLKLTVWGEFPSDLEQDIRISADKTGEKYIQVEVLKETQSKIVYRISGLKTGSSSLIISYTSGGKDYALINMPVGVSSDKKVSCGSITFDANEEYKKIDDKPSSQEGENIQIDGDISASSGSIKIIKLNAGNGSWKAEEWNGDVIDFADNGYEDGQCNFVVTAKAVGVGDLVLANRSENKKLTLSFAVTEFADSEELELTLTDSKVEDLSSSASSGEKKDEHSGNFSNVFESAYFPADAEMKSFVLYSMSDKDVYADEEQIRMLNTVIAGGGDSAETAREQLEALYAGMDSADMELSLNGHDLYYMVTRARSTDALKAELLEGVEFSSEGTYSAGGRSIGWGVTADGFGAALWTDGDSSCMLTLMEETNESALKSVLDAFF